MFDSITRLVAVFAQVALRSRFVLTVIGVLGLCALVFPTPVSAATWYVSPVGPYNGRNGKTWYTAWPDLNQIDWTKVQSGDTIKIDAGAPPPTGSSYLSPVYVYNPLSIGQDNVTIEISSMQNQNGNVAWIRPATSSGTAINIGNHQGITIRGSQWIGAGMKRSPNLAVAGGGIGIYIGPNAQGIVLQNIQFQMCDVGLQVDGGQATCSGLKLNNNLTNVLYNRSSSTGASQSLILNDSWIANDGLLYLNNVVNGYPWAPRSCAGIVTRGQSNKDGSLTVNGCILGPELTTAVDAGCEQTSVYLYNTIINNPLESSLRLTKARSLSAVSLTSFLTPLNKNGKAHSCLSLTQSTGRSDSITKSSFFGGSVDVVGNTSVGSSNIQYKTAGNTVVLSAGQVDPMFVSDLSGVSGTAGFDQLVQLNFAVKPGSPVSSTYPYSLSSFLSKR